jgi:hypothetical protein
MNEIGAAAEPLVEEDYEFLNGCGECFVHWAKEGMGLTHAFASVGIEHGKTTYEMAESYFRSFHKRGHSQTAPTTSPTTKTGISDAS